MEGDEDAVREIKADSLNRINSFGIIEMKTDNHLGHHWLGNGCFFRVDGLEMMFVSSAA
jgi:hypothetical protein